MAEPVLSVCWKDHINELARVYTSFLENSFLVDVTIAAEGRSLKAHRLVLSSCSPYFHKLFREQTDKHPFVILLNASFETLKAVIDFVYQGETQISEGNLKAFVSLAQALQIKGLKAFSEDNMNKNISIDTDGKDHHRPSEKTQNLCEVEGTASLEESPETSQQLSHHWEVFPESVRSNYSFPLEGYSASHEEVQSAQAMTPPRDHQTAVGCNEVPADAEITIKDEPLFPVFSETKNEIVHKVESNGPMSGHCTSDVDGATAFPFGEQNVNQYSCLSGSSHRNVKLSVITSPQQPLVQLGNNVPELYESLLPVEPKSEATDDADNEDPMDDYGASENYTYEGSDEPRVGELILSQCSSTDGVPRGSDLATPQQRTSSPPPLELPVHEGRRAPNRQRSRRRSPPSAGGASAAPSGDRTARIRGQPRKGERSCEVCQKEFSSSSHLRRHQRIHTGERPHRCEVCGKAFIQSGGLAIHKRIHTGERPHRCEVCGKAFMQSGGLAIHKRIHTGERPHRCEVCEKSYALAGTLAAHKRIHTGERPHRCEVCGKAFTESGNVARHMRIHTGERPHRCDVCGKSFTQTGALAAHRRIHTGESPRCDVCGKAFTRSDTLAAHKRIHTGERPHRCEVCGKAFINATGLVTHMRQHTGERPFSCDVCGHDFRQKSTLVIHMRRHTGDRPYSCDVCGEKFRHRITFNRHKSFHTEGASM